MAVFDADNDGDDDVLISGKNDNYLAFTKLYINTNGVFNESSFVFDCFKPYKTRVKL
jgi:hypothetical protein